MQELPPYNDPNRNLDKRMQVVYDRKTWGWADLNKGRKAIGKIASESSRSGDRQASAKTTVFKSGSGANGVAKRREVGRSQGKVSRRGSYSSPSGGWIGDTGDNAVCHRPGVSWALFRVVGKSGTARKSTTKIGCLKQEPGT